MDQRTSWKLQTQYCQHQRWITSRVNEHHSNRRIERCKSVSDKQRTFSKFRTGFLIVESSSSVRIVQMQSVKDQKPRPVPTRMVAAIVQTPWFPLPGLEIQLVWRSKQKATCERNVHLLHLFSSMLPTVCCPFNPGSKLRIVWYRFHILRCHSLRILRQLQLLSQKQRIHRGIFQNDQASSLFNPGFILSEYDMLVISKILHQCLPMLANKHFQKYWSSWRMHRNALTVWNNKIWCCAKMPISLPMSCRN